MSNKKVIQVFEYQKLRVGTGGFDENHFKAMVKFNEKNDNKYFDPIYNGVKFNSYVGVIQIGGLTLEILPKADRDTSNSKHQKDKWQNVLLRMLAVCKHITVDNISETTLNKRYNSILEVYYEMYLNELTKLVKRGLIKKYRRIQSNQLALKGKLVFSQNISKNAVHKERFYCEHQVYDKDHLIHQVLLKALTILDELTNNHLSDKVKTLLFEFEHIDFVNIGASHFRKITLNRKSKVYTKALNIAKMLILNYSPSINYGNENMLTLLFDMNKLWEEYIFRVLHKHKPDGYSVSFQNSAKFWENKTIRPDIVIKDDTNKVFVIDTKWKIVDNQNPSDDDLKQMFTYNLHWEAERSLLLYPKVTQKESSYGQYHYKPTIKNLDETFSKSNNQCRLGFISVVNENGLRDSRQIAETIFLKLA